MFDLDDELNKAIAHYEGRFGHRDTDFRLLPVGFHSQNYAQSLVHEGAGTIAVKLNERVKNNDLLLKYQLWHEAVHCLAPTESIETIWFEEGLAVESAMHAPFVNRKFRKACTADIRASPWDHPWQAFLKLKATDEQIRAVHERAPQRKFDLITSDLIIEVFDAPQQLADTLCQRMGKARP